MKTQKRSHLPKTAKKPREVRKCVSCGLPLGDLDLSVRESYGGKTEVFHIECAKEEYKKYDESHL